MFVTDEGINPETMNRLANDNIFRNNIPIRRPDDLSLEWKSYYKQKNLRI